MPTQGEQGTAVEVAAASGHNGVVRLLLEIGANLEVSALALVAHHGPEGTIQRILEHGAEVSPYGDRPRYGMASNPSLSDAHYSEY